MKVNPRAFTHCPNCGFEYRLKLERTEEADEKRCLGRKSKFRMLLARDAMVAFALIQVVVLLTAGVVLLCDPSHRLAQKYNDVTDSSGFKRVYYIAGLLLVLFIVGVLRARSTCRVRPRQSRRELLTPNE